MLNTCLFNAQRRLASAIMSRIELHYSWIFLLMFATLAPATACTSENMCSFMGQKYERYVLVTIYCFTGYELFQLQTNS